METLTYLLIIDANSLKSLPTSQKSGLKKAIIEQGLGVFIQPDTDFYRFQGDFSDFTFIVEKNGAINAIAFCHLQNGKLTYNGRAIEILYHGNNKNILVIMLNPRNRHFIL